MDKYFEEDKHHEMMSKMVTYAVPTQTLKKGEIKNLPFSSQQGTPVQKLNYFLRYSVILVVFLK